MLRVDLHAAAAGPLDTDAVVPVSDPALADLEVAPTEPVRVSGRLSATGPGSYFWEGRIRTRVSVRCRRCLAPVSAEIDDTTHLLFTEEEDNDDPAVVTIPRRSGDLELGDVIREALILAVPEFPLCREGCRGLCPSCGADLNDGPCGCGRELDPRWAALGALRPPATNDDEMR
jgi:uncharacterized protein